jgi:DNA modification methylase
MQLLKGDCLEVMATLDANSVDTIITDPPYGLSFMGKEWDHGIPGEAFWREALRVAKPGAILMACGGTRTYHRLTCAIEDAGWEIRDCMMFLYGSGFPKSHDISKAIDKKAAAVRKVVGSKVGQRGYSLANNGRTNKVYGDLHDPHAECAITAPATPLAQQWHGWGTALKPAYEPIIVAQKPLDGTYAQNAEKWGVAGLWIDGGRIGTEEIVSVGPAEGGRKFARKYDHNGANLPNITKGTHTGRWPANLILDDEAAAALDAQSGERKAYCSNPETAERASHRKVSGKGDTVGEWGYKDKEHRPLYSDTGGASRFFYCAKASRAERNMGLEGMEERAVAQRYGLTAGGNTPQQTPHLHQPQSNHHPTVKPLAVMRYLCRLTKTPTGGVVLDPFAGSGTTVMAALLEGRDAIGIELNEEYFEIMRRRVEAVQAQIEAEQAKPLQLALAAD